MPIVKKNEMKNKSYQNVCSHVQVQSIVHGCEFRH
jgi:hypothetical protein